MSKKDGGDKRFGCETASAHRRHSTSERRCRPRDGLGRRQEVRLRDGLLRRPSTSTPLVTPGPPTGGCEVAAVARVAHSSTLSETGSWDGGQRWSSGCCQPPSSRRAVDLEVTEANSARRRRQGDFGASNRRARGGGGGEGGPATPPSPRRSRDGGQRWSSGCCQPSSRRAVDLEDQENSDFNLYPSGGPGASNRREQGGVGGEGGLPLPPHREGLGTAAKGGRRAAASR